MGNVLKASDLSDDTFQQQLRSRPADVRDLGQPIRQALALSRTGAPTKRTLGRHEIILLGTLVFALHASALYWVSQREVPELPEIPVQVPPMTIEFTTPAPPPPPEPEPIPEPVVEPPPPVVDELAVKPPPKKVPPKPKPVPPPPKPVPKPVETPPAPPAPTPTPPAPPAPPAPAPLTPPTNAGYLRNPAPEYPSLALRRGWEGTVLLRVHVLANGRPSEIQIQTSSGREVLDKAAVKAVQGWSFVPAKRGDVAQDGWVTVPVDFKLN